MTYDEEKKLLGSPKTGRDRGNGLVLNVEMSYFKASLGVSFLMLI